MSCTQNFRKAQARLWPIDALRGLLMILMALDHANLMIAQRHPSGEYWGGLFPSYDSALAFITRFVSHFCAPGFFFLMGTSLVLMAHARQKRGWTRWQTSRRLLVRGALLIILQLTLVNLAWSLSPGGWNIDLYIGVLFGLGSAMILSGLLLWLPSPLLIVLSLLLILGSEWLTPDLTMWGQDIPLYRMMLAVPFGILGRGERTPLWVNYPILPWLPLVMLGIVFGRALRRDAKRTFTYVLWIGLTCLGLFALIRSLNSFGNLRPRKNETWIAFLNVCKYPPSIAFMLLTNGVNLVLLGLLAQVKDKLKHVLSVLTVFGQSTLFFYVLHLYVYLAIGWIMTPHGTSFAWMYLFWLHGLLILWPLCLLYGRFKRRQPLQSPWHLM